MNASGKPGSNSRRRIIRFAMPDGEATRVAGGKPRYTDTQRWRFSIYLGYEAAGPELHNPLDCIIHLNAGKERFTAEATKVRLWL
jgi:hypothetical protein